MDNQVVYEVADYELIGKTLHVFEERKDLGVLNGEVVTQDLIKYKRDTRNRICIGLSDYKKDALFSSEEKLLPYFADVTEDVPEHLKEFRRTYENCQLMTEKHGGYLQFLSQDGKVLRIALNSHYYTPL